MPEHLDAVREFNEHEPHDALDDAAEAGLVWDGHDEYEWERR
ncbi:hypothetical protein [Streptomyces sp. AV19]|nr:hypothetical protein [Streptomyces sp. AV19]MDG4531451.1 hypothetical protein [Streptomyces sp. AV19]